MEGSGVLVIFRVSRSACARVWDARHAGHVHVQGQSHRAHGAVAGTGQEHNPTLPQLQPIS